MAHTFTTVHSASTIEARDMTVKPLSFATDPMTALERYSVGDSAIVTTCDQAEFIGHVIDVDEFGLRVFIELD